MDSKGHFVSENSDCSTCRFFDESDFSCLAFPNGIPITFLSGKRQHRKTVKGQDNRFVTYEKREFKSIPGGYINASGRFIDAEYVTLYRILADSANDDVSCYRCAHWHGEEKDDKCDAFPEGIPEVITNGKFRHDQPYPNAENPEDNGILFTETI